MPAGAAAACLPAPRCSLACWPEPGRASTTAAAPASPAPARAAPPPGHRHQRGHCARGAQLAPLHARGGGAGHRPALAGGLATQPQLQCRLPCGGPCASWVAGATRERGPGRQGAPAAGRGARGRLAARRRRAFVCARPAAGCWLLATGHLVTSSLQSLHRARMQRLGRSVRLSPAGRPMSAVKLDCRCFIAGGALPVAPCTKPPVTHHGSLHLPQAAASGRAGRSARTRGLLPCGCVDGGRRRPARV